VPGRYGQMFLTWEALNPDNISSHGLLYKLAGPGGTAPEGNEGGYGGAAA